MTRPIVVAAGGTGGHVIPALAVADVLKTRDIPVVWLGTKSGLEARLVPAAGIDIRWISVAGLRGKSLIESVTAPLKLLHACMQSIRLIHSIKPQAVLGMGGFVSGPVGIAALLLRKPLVLHEQNAVAGMTNRWLSHVATRVFAAWPGAFVVSAKTKVVGNPVRQDIAELAKAPHIIDLDAKRPLRILIVGGSRGAQALNETVPMAIAMLNESVQVHHQAGMQDAELVRSRYNDAPRASVVVEEFIDDMAAAYQNADVVICRSGAMTVTELSALGVPSVLVPFPYAVDDHQTRNAQHLSVSGAAVLMPQASLNAESLADVLRSFIVDRTTLETMSKAASRCFAPHAAEAVADALMEVSR
jgi:UDP-N-acetylglucosamine--N-acetylmuramyl-(pentapeptide) pyrophosphoryl-undecaprenol N-acetylglucosamine transferase